MTTITKYLIWKFNTTTKLKFAEKNITMPHIWLHIRTWVRDFQSLLADPIYMSLPSDIQTFAWTMPDPHQSPSSKVTFCTFDLPEARSADSWSKSGENPECWMILNVKQCYQESMKIFHRTRWMTLPRNHCWQSLQIVH